MNSNPQVRIGVGVMVFKNGKILLGIGMTAELTEGNPKIMEKEKCAGWGWYDLNDLPRPLFSEGKQSNGLFSAEENYLEA